MRRVSFSPILSCAILSCAVFSACNAPPEGLAISLTPEAPITTDELTVVIDSEAVDENDDPVEYSYQWAVDGEVQSDLTSSTLGFGNTEKGQEWEVTVTPSDGKVAGTPVRAAVTINNAPPTAEVSVSPESPTTEDDIRIEVQAADADSDPVSLTYRWVLNGSPSTDTDSRLSADRTNKGEVWEIIVTPNDGEADGEEVVVSVTIANTPPSVYAATVRSDSGRVDRAATLSCVGSGWVDVDGDAEGYQTRWLINGEVVPGAVDASLSEGFVRGDEVQCELTPFDGEEAGLAVTSDAVVVLNTPPSLDTVSIGPESPTREDTVTATMGTATDIDGDTVSYLYAWRVDGRVVGTGETLVSSRFVRGSEIELIVTPTDGTDEGEPVTSNALEGGNNLPTITSVTLSPTSVYTDSTIEAELRATDPDGDSTTASVEWYVNSSKVSVTSTDLDGSSWFDKGDTVYAIVRADDGYDKGEPVTTSTLTVLNSPPTAPELSLSPTEPGEGDDLVCKIDAASTDADGDSITYTFTWEVAGSSVKGGTTTYTGDTLDAADYTVDDKVICTVTPHDGDESGTPAEARTTGETKELTFPSSKSTLSSGGTLGTGGGGMFYKTGDYVTETFTATGVTEVDEIDYELEMDDRTTSYCKVGTLRFGVKINGTEVDTYSYVGGSTKGRIKFTGSSTFSSIKGTGSSNDTYVLRIESKDTVCPGASSWNWYSGGTFTFNP